ncbi:MAG: hypothetical protein BGN97_14120 [Microbacterium sp. 69-10]|nr:MAG: hypothetical protein BGN97_14120 [Microbacterium sp. 69-10]
MTDLEHWIDDPESEVLRGTPHLRVMSGDRHLFTDQQCCRQVQRVEGFDVSFDGLGDCVSLLSELQHSHTCQELIGLRQRTPVTPQRADDLSPQQAGRDERRLEFQYPLVQMWTFRHIENRAQSNR